MRLTGVALTGLALLGCGGGSSAPTSPQPAPILQISGMPSEPLTVGQTVPLRAVTTSGGATTDVTTTAIWRTSNAAVATVSPVGALTATGEGEADIQASYQALNASSRVRVQTRPAPDERFKVAVLTMDGRSNPPPGDVERIFARAAGLFLAKTGATLAMIDRSSAAPGSPVTAAQSYVNGLEPGKTMPDGVLAFSDDTESVTFGGYSQVFVLPPPNLNTFPSPYRSPTFGYLAVQDFFHIYSRCGYDARGNRISDRSANGECRNQTGLLCVNNGRNWVCPDTLNDLYAEDDYYAACTIVHELAHPFGPLGNLDHYGTAECTARTGMTPAQASDRRLFQESCGLCPDVYRNIRR
jgi:hypothetical protein